MARPPTDKIIAALVADRAVNRALSQRLRDKPPKNTLLVAQQKALLASDALYGDMDVSDFLFGLAKGPQGQPPDTQRPSDVTGLTATLDGLVVVLDSNLATDNFGIGGYQDERENQTDAPGVWVALPFSQSTLHRDEESPTLRGKTLNYRRKAVDTALLISLNYSNVATAVVPATNLPDTTAPNTPGSAPTVTSTVSTAIQLTLGAVTDPTVVGQVKSDMRRYKVERRLHGVGSYTHRGYTPAPSALLSPYEDSLVGGLAGTRTPVSSAVTMACVGGSQWWGTSDQLFMSSAQKSGAYYVKVRVDSANSGSWPWGKTGRGIRAGLDPQSPSIQVVWFQNGICNLEWRPGNGAEMQQYEKSGLTFPFYWDFAYDGLGRTVARWCQTENGTYTPFGPAVDIPGMPEIYELFDGCCAQQAATALTSTFTVLSEDLTGQPVVFRDSGTVATGYDYRYLGEDRAGNPGSFSPVLFFTTDAGSGDNIDHPRYSFQKYGNIDGLYADSTTMTIVGQNADLLMCDYYEGYPGGTIVRDGLMVAKNINSALLVGKYCCDEAIHVSGSETPSGTIRNAQLAMDARVKRFTGGGSFVYKKSWFSDSQWAGACCNAGPVNGLGELMCEMYPRMQIEIFISPATGAGNVTIPVDILMADNWFPEPRNGNDGPADWRFTGSSNQDGSTCGDIWQDGRVKFRNKVKAVRPTLMVGGNVSQRGVTKYFKLLEMQQLEASFGETWSYGGLFSEQNLTKFKTVLREYHATINELAAPAIAHMTVRCDNLTSYQQHRFALGYILLDDGFLCFDNHDTGASRASTYVVTQEMQVQRRFGRRVGAKHTGDAPNYAGGTYMARFEKILSVCNPNPFSVTIDLDETVTILPAPANAGRTPGAAVTRVTIAAWDSFFGKRIS